MKYFAVLCTLVIIAAVPALAIATDEEYTDTVDLYRILDNFQYTDSPIATSWEHNAVYTEGDEKIPLTIYADDADEGHTVTVYARSSSQDQWEELGTLNTMTYLDNHGVYTGYGNPERDHLTSTTFYLEPSYIANGLYVETRLNPMWQEGEVRVEIERSILGVHHTPEPASLILGTLGMSLVGYLRRRKAL